MVPNIEQSEKYKPLKFEDKWWLTLCIQPEKNLIYISIGLWMWKPGRVAPLKLGNLLDLNIDISIKRPEYIMFYKEATGQKLYFQSWFIKP